MDNVIRDLELQWRKDPTRENEFALYTALWRSGRLLSEWAPGDIPPALDDYNWREAFGYAGEDGTLAGNLPKLFSRRDIRKIIAMSEGENDGYDWVLLAQLWDGRYAALRAGCDYTGWD